MVSRRKPDWYELVDGPLAGERRIGLVDERGRFTAERYTGHGIDAVREEFVYEALPHDPWKREKLRARWVRAE